MDSAKNTLGIILLIGLLLLFSVGGYFFMDYMTKENDDGKKEKEEEKVELRIDTSKDYVYFANSEEIIHETFKEDAILNFKGLEDINDKLHSELENLSKNKVTTANVDVPEGVTCDEDLYSFSYREYITNTYSKYVSLVVQDYDYNCVKGTIPKNLKSYVVDKETGLLINEETLIADFGVNEDKIIEAVRARLNTTQVLDENVQVIDIEGTINSLKSGTYGVDKALSVSKNGKLMINFVVKSNKINYNDSVEIENEQGEN